MLNLNDVIEINGVCQVIDYKDQKYLSLKQEFEPAYVLLQDKIRSYYDFSVSEGELLNSAYNLALYAHRDQLRRSGKPYFVHLLAVANILADFKLDMEAVVSGLLHDTIEDTFVNREELEKIFGKTITDIVDGVTKIGEISGKLGPQIQQAENFRKMLLSMTNDVRVLLIKLADRLHNMSTLEYMPAKKRERIAKETLEVYAPLAHRFGMGKIKSELEDLAFKFLDNKKFQELARKINEKKEEREAYIRKVIIPIEAELINQNKKFKIYGRPKHLYSIHQKMEKRGKKFEELYDLFAIRILVDSIEDCYFALGVVHQIYIPVYDRFKDYISVPKTNGYQSLHTTVLGPEGKLVEVQIRTYDMHQIAESGIAAHWLYKENIGKKRNKIKNDDYETNISHIRNLLEEFGNQGEGDFLKELKVELYEDDVFVFTPKGDVFRLPQGATPIDFAFAVHTNVGMHCIGAKVNDKIVSLKYILHSGEIVEIITSQNQHPNANWLKTVKTGKARNRIKKFLKEEKFDEDAKRGEEIYHKELQAAGVNEKDVNVEQLLEKCSLKTPKHFYAMLGRGEMTISRVMSLLNITPPKKKSSGSFITKILGRTKTDDKILVDGQTQVDVSIAGCCQPLPGDDIVGYITKSKGITVHKKDCPNLLKMISYRDRVVPVDWEKTPQLYYKTTLFIEADERKNLLKDITTVLAANNSGIINIEMKRVDNKVSGFIIIEVNSLQQLNKIIQQIRREKGVKVLDRK